MGIIRTPKPVKFFVGMLSSDPVLFDACADILCSEYGTIDQQSGACPWNFTEYYREELGRGILRKFIFFQMLRDPGDLALIKHFTNRMEERYAVGGDNAKRRINLDPGYLAESKVVLATTKDYAHRIYVGEGIYAEVTLLYRNGGYVPLDSTYPDYRTPECLALFETARGMLRACLHS